MRIGKMSLTFLVCYFLGLQAVYAVPEEDTTEFILRACDNVGSENKRLDDLATAICVYQISGFLEGYKQGADHGAIIAFIHDLKNLNTTEGIKDIVVRKKNIQNKVRCIPENFDLNEVVAVWATFVKLSEEDLGKKHYASTLRDAIEYFYCSEH